jgi:hypothetical protein
VFVPAIGVTVILMVMVVGLLVVVLVVPLPTTLFVLPADVLELEVCITSEVIPAETPVMLRMELFWI